MTLPMTNVDVADVTIDVTGAQDATGNAQEAYTPEAEFSIDTANPSVVSVDGERHADHGRATRAPARSR